MRSLGFSWLTHLASDDGRQSILTKGDNNDRTDEALYPLGQTYVYREQVIGLVRGYVPYVGWITLAAQEMPWLKPLLVVGFLVFSVFPGLRRK